MNNKLQYWQRAWIMPFCLSLLYAPQASSADQPPITVAWRNKPPYHYLENGVERGFLLERSKKIFALAKIEAIHITMPTKRIWQNFAFGQKNFCSIGWYRIPERESLVNFSHAFHVDPPHTVLVAPAALAAVQAHNSLASLFKDKNLTVGVVDGVSYGAQLDTMLAQSANKVEKRTLEPAAMMRMLAANRIAFMLVDSVDWDFLRQHDEFLSKLHNIDFADMPKGLTRYIVCSKDVPQEQMDKINLAIDSLPVSSTSNASASAK